MTAPASKFVGQEFMDFMRRLAPDDVTLDESPSDGTIWQFIKSRHPNRRRLIETLGDTMNVSFFLKQRIAKDKAPGQMRHCAAAELQRWMRGRR